MTRFLLKTWKIPFLQATHLRAKCSDQLQFQRHCTFPWIVIIIHYSPPYICRLTSQKRERVFTKDRATASLVDPHQAGLLGGPLRRRRRRCGFRHFHCVRARREESHKQGRAQREGGRGGWGRETNGATEAGAGAARREAGEGDGGGRPCPRLFPPASCSPACPGRRTLEKWAIVAVVGFIGWAA
jgi:hypothetical protein